MGKTFSIEKPQKTIEEILNYTLIPGKTEKVEKDEKASKETGKEIEENDNHKTLRVWEIKENKEEKAIIESYNFAVNKESTTSELDLNTKSSYIILLCFIKDFNCNLKEKERKEEEESSTRSDLLLPENEANQEVILSSMTNRGLEYVFSSDASEEISFNDLSNKTKKVKYSVFLWNGSESKEQVKSFSLIQAHKLSQALSNKELLFSLIENDEHNTTTTENIMENINNKKMLKVNFSPTVFQSNTSPTKALPEKKKKKKKEKFKNFKSAFINSNTSRSKENSLQLKESLNPNSTDDRKISVKQSENLTERQNRIMENYYNLFETFSTKRSVFKIPKKSSLSSRHRKKSFKKSEDNSNYVNEEADYEEIDDLENDIFLPKTSLNYEKEDERKNIEEVSTTGLSSNFSLNFNKENKAPNFTIKKIEAAEPEHEPEQEPQKTKLNLNLGNLEQVQNQLKLPSLDLHSINISNKLVGEENTELCFKDYSSICSEILDGFLFLSGQDVAGNEKILEENKITHIINSAGEICQCFFPDKIQYLKFNLRDNSNEVSLIN